jgi:signal transduction histidine kinase
MADREARAGGPPAPFAARIRVGERASVALGVDRIEAAKLRLLAGSPGPLVGAAMTSAAAGIALWFHLDHRVVVAWTAAMVLCTAVRFRLWRGIRRDFADDAKVIARALPLAAAIGVSGALWGLFGISFYLLDEAEIRGFVLLVLASMLASGTIFYSSYLPAHGAYVLGCALPVAAASFLHGSATSVLFGAMTFGYVALIFRGGAFFNRSIEGTFRLQFQNAELIEGLRAAKNAADEASRTKSRFLATMSHELRTPLNAVIGYSEMMLEEAEGAGNAEQAADLRKIHGAGKHLLALVNDVLDLSKIEAGKAGLDADGFDLGGLVDEVAVAAEPLVLKNGNTLEVARAADLGAAVGDATKLRQVLLNLLSNAAKFTRNGRVTLAAARERGLDGDWIVISVRDTGIGISAAGRAKLFQSFSQLDLSIGRNFGGTGLGLALSRQLCELMGGTITVESEPGRGSCFTVRVPAMIAGRAPEPAATPRQAPVG